MSIGEYPFDLADRGRGGGERGTGRAPGQASNAMIAAGGAAPSAADLSGRLTALAA